MTGTIFLERMRWPEVRDALDSGRRTVIVPVGATEQHGPHLPLSVDAERGTRLGAEVARRLGALVAPTIRVGCSDHHMAFPGTISIRRSTLEALCRDYSASLAAHGFENICLLPSHGGNFEPLGAMVDELNELVGPRSRVVAYTDLAGFVEIWRAAVEAECGLGDRVGGHADIAESSEMLAIHPDLVRADLAAAGYLGGLSPEFFERVIREGFHTVTPTGVLGDARGLSRSLGERCLEATADAIAAHFRRELGGHLGGPEGTGP